MVIDSKYVASIEFGVTGQESATQSATIHSAKPLNRSKSCLIIELLRYIQVFSCHNLSGTTEIYTHSHDEPGKHWQPG